MDKKLNILIVDDEETIRDLFTRILSKEHNVTTLYNGKEVEKFIGKDPFDLAFIDMRMPVMDGFETFLLLKEMNPGITGVMITGYADEMLINSTIREGAVTCLRKPFNIQDIKDIVKIVLEKKYP